MLGSGDGVADGRVDYGDAGPGSGVQVDVVHPDAGASDHLEITPGGNDGLRDLGFAAHHQGVIAGNGGDKFVGGKAALDVNGHVLFQQVDALRGYVVGNQYFGHKKSASSNLDPIGRTLVRL